jgi:hypothetical protein
MNKPTWWDGSDTAATLTKSNAGGGQRMPDKDNLGAVIIPLNSMCFGRENEKNERQCMGIGDEGDPQFTLQKNHSHAVAYGFQQASGQKKATLNIREELSVPLTGGQDHNLVAYVDDTLYIKGINQGVLYACAQEANTRTILSILREEIGAEAFTQWGLGILYSFYKEEILQSNMYGEKIRNSTPREYWPIYCSLSCEKDLSERAMQSVWEAQCLGCTSQRWQPSESKSRELGAYLSKLSHESTPGKSFLFDLWCASQGSRILHQALSAIQKTWESIEIKLSNKEKMFDYRLSIEEPFKWDVWKTQDAIYKRNIRKNTKDKKGMCENEMAVRRLTPRETERLQGFPDDFTRIPWKGKPPEQCPDGPRYKAIGNSMCVNVLAWIGRRIEMVEAL